MEQLNLHKLINLRKKIASYDCDVSKDILAVIDSHLPRLTQLSAQRKIDYQQQLVSCPHCHKSLKRSSYYRHLNTHL